MTRRTVLAALAGLIAVLALGALNYPLYEHVREQRVLEQTGILDSAPVVSTEATGSGVDAIYTVTWQVPGRDGPTTEERTSEVDREAFTAAESQRTIDVRYPEGRPGQAYAEARTTAAPGMPMWVIWVDLALLVLLLALGATVGRSHVRGAADRFLGSEDGSVAARE